MLLDTESDSIHDAESISIGDTVYVGSGTDRVGKVAFIGETQFASGEWIGVILSAPNGKNDGSVSGISYFKCKPLHGIFSKRQNIRLATQIDAEIHKLPLEEETGDAPLPVSSKNIGGTTSSNSPRSSLENNSPAHASAQSTGFQVGDRVQVSGGRVGVLRFLGPTEFAAGEWAGIELDDPLGKNDGSVGGKRYFSCKPNFGLFALASKLYPPGSNRGLATSTTPQHRRSQESLVSYCSNLSSVSRSYRAQYMPSLGRSTTPNIRRPASVLTSSNQKEQQSTIQNLQRLVKEKEDHISQLLQEREMERSDLAKVTLDRELAESEVINQRTLIERLNQQLQSMEAAHQLLQEEYEQMNLRLHEEKKNLEDLQFRMEEENINKSTLELRNADDESKIFELEEALMCARETNEHTEAELARVRAELAEIQARQVSTTSTATITDQTGPQEAEGSQNRLKGDGTAAPHEQSEPEVRDAKVGSPSKLSLHRVNLVSQASVAPVQTHPDSALQAECERLRRELADRERITESALKRQADVLQVVTSDFEKQLADLNAQLLSSSKELVASRQEYSSLKEEMKVTTAQLQEEIHQLKVKYSEEESKAKEKLACYQNRVDELSSKLETEKGKTSATVLEQSLALRKLEEKLRITERQLLDYQASVVSSAQESVQTQIAQVHEMTEGGSSSLDKAALLEQLTKQQAAYEQQMEQLRVLESERNAAMETQRASGDRIGVLEAELASLREELVSSARKQEELVEQLKLANVTRDQLLSDLSLLLNELPPAPRVGATGGDDSARDMAQDLRLRIELLGKQVADTEANRNALESQVESLLRERADLERELTVLTASQPSQTTQQDVAGMLEQLESARQKVCDLEVSTSAALKDLEQKSNELERVQQSLDKTLLERDQLQKAHQQTMAILETERRQLQERIRLAESNSQSPFADRSAGPAVDGNEQLSRLMEEKAGAESQIAFLNSIIVDLHEKNRELEERVQNMLTLGENSGLPRNKATVQRPPRRWCDNCLVFDSHETEDCPKKPEVLENGYKPRKKLSVLASQPLSDRMYCDMCGVFDSHNTENCTDSQTF